MAKQTAEKKATENTSTPKAAQQEKSTNKTTEDRSFQEKVTVVSNKVGETIKTGAQKVFRFTGSATKLSKLKVEVHNLQNQVEKIQLETGKKLWEMHKQNKLGEMDSAFDVEFKRIENLQKQIADKEKDAESISLVE